MSFWRNSPVESSTRSAGSIALCSTSPANRRGRLSGSKPGSDRDQHGFTMNHVVRLRVMWVKRLILIAVVSIASCGWSQSDSTNTPALAGENELSEADKAWKELLKAFRPPMVPAEWQLKRPTPAELETFRAERARMAGDALNKAREFCARFPGHPKAAEAKKKAEGLRFAVLMESAQHVFQIEDPSERITKLPEQEKAARDLI